MAILRSKNLQIWIQDKEMLTKEEYNAQVGRQTEFAFVLGGKPLILVSLGDAIQKLYPVKSMDSESKVHYK